MAWNYGLGVAVWLYPALLAVTARRRNGFATVIDLLTKTRVIQKSAYEPRESVAQTEEPVAATEAMPKIGPYHVLAPLGADDDGELLLGYDTKLMRRVWIRKVAADAAPVAAELRNAARPGRLRWLQGHRNGADAWDAYEAVPGTPLIELLRTPQPWKNVRHWLLDLADGIRRRHARRLAARARSRSTACGSPPAAARSCSISARPARRPPCGDDPRRGGRRLSQPTRDLRARRPRRLCGGSAHQRAARAGAAARASLLRALRTAAALSAIAAELRTLIQQHPAISRRRRLGVIIGCIIGALIMVPFTIMGATILGGLQNRNRAALAVAVDKGGEHNRAPRSSKSNDPSRLVILLASAFTVGCLGIALLSAGFALFFRGGLLLRALGVAAVTCDGSDASRWRMLWRACVAWSWLPLGLLLVALLAPTLQPIPAAAIAGLLAIGTVAASAALPARSLQDRLAGTWLVPR